MNDYASKKRLQKDKQHQDVFFNVETLQQGEKPRAPNTEGQTFHYVIRKLIQESEPGISHLFAILF